MVYRRVVRVALILGLLWLPLGCDDEPAAPPPSREQADYAARLARIRAEVDAAKSARLTTTAPTVSVPRPVTTGTDVPPPTTVVPPPSAAPSPEASPAPEASAAPAPAPVSAP